MIYVGLTTLLAGILAGPSTSGSPLPIRKARKATATAARTLCKAIDISPAVIVPKRSARQSQSQRRHCDLLVHRWVFGPPASQSQLCLPSPPDYTLNPVLAMYYGTWDWSTLTAATPMDATPAPATSPKAAGKSAPKAESASTAGAEAGIGIGVAGGTSSWSVLGSERLASCQVSVYGRVEERGRSGVRVTCVWLRQYKSQASELSLASL